MINDMYVIVVYDWSFVINDMYVILLWTPIINHKMWKSVNNETIRKMENYNLCAVITHPVDFFKILAKGFWHTRQVKKPPRPNP